MKQPHNHRPTGSGTFHRGARAYTLIELLVVISIIAALAAITLAVMPGTAHWRIRRAVEAQMQQLEMVIERYKNERGYYPPSNPNSSTYNLLFYELVGAEYDAGTPDKFSVIGRPNLSIDQSQIIQVYGDTNRNRIYNSAVRSANPGYLDPNDPDAGSGGRSFHADIKNKYLKATNGIIVINVPGPGPGGEEFNPWHYQAPGRHNPESFDLWAEVLLGEEVKTIANWKD